MTRFKAFGIHLGISLAILVLVLGLLILVWYPWPLFDLEGGWQGIRLITLVDVVLGPALTLILFKSGKRGLKFDMSMVVLMQIGALMYGMWNLYEARPVLLVHADDHFKPISRTLVAEWDSSGAVLRQWERMTPQSVRVDLPADPEVFVNLYLESRNKPGGLHGLAERYAPLHDGWQQVLQDAIRIKTYVSFEAKWEQRFNELMDTLDRPIEELAFFPYIGRHKRAFLVFDRETQDIVGVLDITYDPALARPEVSRIERKVLTRRNEPGRPPPRSERASG